MKKNIRTLIVLGVPLDLTGSGVVVKNLLKEYHKNKAEVMLLTTHFRHLSNSELGIPKDIPVETVIFDEVPVFSAGFQFPNIRFTEMTEEKINEYIKIYVEKLRKVIRDFQPDVINTHHIFLLNTAVKRIAPHLPLVCTSHGTEIKMLTEDKSLYHLVTPAAQITDRIIAVSEEIKKQVIELFGVKEDRVKVIGNGYDPKIFYPHKPERAVVLGRYGIKDEYDKIVVFVGKFSAWKGIKYLIEAAGLYGLNSDRTLTLIAGNGSETMIKQYKDQINKLGISNNVKLIIPPDNNSASIAEIMAMGDIFVLPSYLEPFGLVLLEALGSGMRVVYGHIGGPKEFVPKKLVDSKFAMPITPLKTIKDKPDPSDEMSYSNRISEAVTDLLNVDISPKNKKMIAGEVKFMSWSSIYNQTRIQLIEAVNHCKPSTYIHLASPIAKRKDIVGAKAAGLNFLIHAGVPVPPGFVLTVPNFSFDIDFNIAKAVRSSAFDEDGLTESKSGFYESILDCLGYHGVMGAIDRVWDSSSRENGMAVIVQDYIEAKASGVVHSVNILTGKPEVIIECSLNAEDVTDGKVVPDRFRFINDGKNPVFFEKTIQVKNKSALSLKQAEKLAQDVIRLADEYEVWTGIRNIDVEFCVSEDDITYFVQIRPLINICQPDLNPILTGINKENNSQPEINLDGICASPGVTKGRLLVIDMDGYGTETDFFNIAKDKVEVGDIVCVPTVNISWLVLLDKISGLITERGGVTSHSANLTRERNIPCLVGAISACDILKFLDGKFITMDALNSVIYEGDAPLIEKPLNDLVWKSMRDNREYDRKEPSHWFDTKGKEWARKPVHPMEKLQFQLYLEAWFILNKEYPEFAIPIKTKNNVIYAGFDELIAFGDAILSGEAADAFDFFTDRKMVVQKMAELMEDFTLTPSSLEKFYELYSRMIFHFHIRAEFRRRVALVLRDKVIRDLPAELVNVINYLISFNAPLEITETRKYDEAYRELLRSCDADGKKLILNNYRISRQQLDDWNAPLPESALNEKLEKDLVDGILTAPEKAQTVRTIEGFKAYLETLRPYILSVDSSFDFDYFKKVIILSEEQAIQVENERHLQHRWQQLFRKKLLDCKQELIKSGLLSSKDNILNMDKDEVLNLVRKLNSLPALPKKDMVWSKNVEAIEFHPTNDCNLSKFNCCKGVCTYGSLHGAKAIFPFASLDAIAKLKPKLVYIVGGGEPTMYKDGDKTLADVILRLRLLLPDANIILGTNGVSLPDGDWQQELDAIRVSLHAFQEDSLNLVKPNRAVESWENLWRYFAGPIGEVWATFKYDGANYLDIFAIAERLWYKREKLCKANPRLYKKELGLKITPIADDSRPNDPFHLSNPTLGIYRKWTSVYDQISKSETQFGEYLRKLQGGFVDTGFILPKEVLTGHLFYQAVNPAEKCVPVVKYVLAAADGNYYACPVEAVKQRALGRVGMSADELLNKRKKAYNNLGGHCLKGCRMKNTFMYCNAPHNYTS